MNDKNMQNTTKDDSATKESGKSTMKPLGFLAVSAVAASGMATFPIIPGFDQSGPRADLQAKLKESGWTGYALAIGADGKLRVRGISKKA